MANNKDLIEEMRKQVAEGEIEKIVEQIDSLITSGQNNYEIVGKGIQQRINQGFEQEVKNIEHDQNIQFQPQIESSYQQILKYRHEIKEAQRK